LIPIRFGTQVCGDLSEGSQREWLAADGLGGYAMGSVSGLRTRRYHGLLVVATQPPIGRRLGLASLDPVLVIADRRWRLATNEWAGGAIDPAGHQLMEGFELRSGVPTWRWQIGDVVLERELAMARGRSAVGVTHTLVRAPTAVRLELSALCTWRDIHGERFADGEPSVEPASDGFVFEGNYRVVGPGFEPGGTWYAGTRYRMEAERGLSDREDLWFAGTFALDLSPGDHAGVVAWAGDLDQPPPPAAAIVAAARRRAEHVAAQSEPDDDVDASLAVAADQFIVAGPTVVAGYPWFGEWSRDTMTSYDGLFLQTHRWDEGRALLERAADQLSEGMLANTSDVGGTPEYNTADATLWFANAVGRHVEVTGDLDLAASMAGSLEDIVERHVAGTRFGLVVDRADGLLTQGAPGMALTWMDARVDGEPVTGRAGKAVEINSLWINALATVGDLMQRLGKDAPRVRAIEARARETFRRRFVPNGAVRDVVDGGGGDDPSVRPNQLLAVSLPHAPLSDGDLARRVVSAVAADLLTPLGLRSLSPFDHRYIGHHRGSPTERDRAYHQGTVWPWLIGPYVDAVLAAGLDASGSLTGLEAHLAEWGLGSVSETADGDPPHGATGCPFQAWSVAELFRARRRLARSTG
jgi:predicted glycogen debranching enzyme